MIQDLNNDTFLIYAMKCYEKPNCILSEFEEDLKRIKYLKRLVKKYKETGDLKERLILNHIIVLGNVFGVEGVVRMLFFKFDKEDYNVLKPFLMYLNYIPSCVIGIKGKDINTNNIAIDLNVSKKLMSI